MSDSENSDNDFDKSDDELFDNAGVAEAKKKKQERMEDSEGSDYRADSPISRLVGVQKIRTCVRRFTK